MSSVELMSRVGGTKPQVKATLHKLTKTRQISFQGKGGHTKYAAATASGLPS